MQAEDHMIKGKLKRLLVHRKGSTRYPPTPPPSSRAFKGLMILREPPEEPPPPSSYQHWLPFALSSTIFSPLHAQSSCPFKQIFFAPSNTIFSPTSGEYSCTIQFSGKIPFDYF